MYIPIHYIIILVLVIFSIGALGVLANRNLIVILMSIELMLNSVNLLFLGFARLWKDMGGEIIVFFVMAVAAAEAAIGLALLIVLHRNFGTVNIDVINKLKG